MTMWTPRKITNRIAGRHPEVRRDRLHQAGLDRDCVDEHDKHREDEQRQFDPAPGRRTPNALGGGRGRRGDGGGGHGAPISRVGVRSVWSVGGGSSVIALVSTRSIGAACADHGRFDAGRQSVVGCVSGTDDVGFGFPAVAPGDADPTPPGVGSGRSATTLPLSGFEQIGRAARWASASLSDGMPCLHLVLRDRGQLVDAVVLLDLHRRQVKPGDLARDALVHRDRLPSSVTPT